MLIVMRSCSSCSKSFESHGSNADLIRNTVVLKVGDSAYPVMRNAELRPIRQLALPSNRRLPFDRRRI